MSATGTPSRTAKDGLSTSRHACQDIRGELSTFRGKSEPCQYLAVQVLQIEDGRHAMHEAKAQVLQDAVKIIFLACFKKGSANARYTLGDPAGSSTLLLS
jgi:hypothetical protein